ncbi:MAG: FadR family transcriptional regulator [Clostridia bacterium]|nr:FadR family transcriptional regulator [Clostridia bacterium]
MSGHSTPKAEYVAEKIKNMLFSGEFKRGDKLPSEGKLAADLDVGRSSVREALRLLNAGGYVEIIPNRGAFAAATSEDETPSPRSWLELNADKVAELLNVRLCIEPFAAELCAQNITEEGLALLKELLDRFENALDSRNWTLLAKCDLEFHRTILTESHNRYLIRMYQPLLEAFMQYSRRSFAATYSQGDTYKEHRAIYNAIALHAADEARVAMQLHIITAKRQVKFTEKV